MSDPIVPNSYLVFEHWENACMEIIQDDFRDWQDWSMTDFQTGNPIYSLHNPRINKAIRIIHFEEEAVGEHFGGIYTKKALGVNYMDDDIDELVFTLPCNAWATKVFKLAFSFRLNAFKVG